MHIQRFTFDVVNPYSGALIDSVANCGAEETDLAIDEVIFILVVNDDDGDFDVSLFCL